MQNYDFFASGAIEIASPRDNCQSHRPDAVLNWDTRNSNWDRAICLAEHLPALMQRPDEGASFRPDGFGQLSP